LDAVEFGGQTTDISEGRFPDGGEQIGFPSQPTPRGPNRSLNTPPRILIAEQFTVSAGDQLRVFIPVLDEDLPPQQLNFFLISGPPNAQLDTASGLLVWHPAAPGDYPFDIEVRDNGRPNLSSSFRFRILVSPSAIMLTCETIPGVPYRIEYTDNLDEQNWRPLLNWTAAQSFTVIEDLGLGQDQRFYRLLRVNP
jgi:hypothetical protein